MIKPSHPRFNLYLRLVLALGGGLLALLGIVVFVGTWGIMASIGFGQSASIVMATTTTFVFGAIFGYSLGSDDN